MKLPNDNFCVLPWVSIETSPVGTVRPCCLARDEIVDDSGNKFKLAKAGFAQMQNSRHMRELRQAFLNGERPETCTRCWAEEDSGRTSKRQHTINRLRDMLPDQSWTVDAKPLMFLDLKLGNICNLKCRICGSWSSSTYATEEIKFLPQAEKKSSFHYQMLRDGAWPRSSDNFWTELNQNIQEIRYIEFTGGEPFMIQEHFDLLQTIVDQGYAGQIEIHYNTNGTQYPENAEKIWRHFKLVEIAFSIDDISKRFEYQRANARWLEVCENLDRFRDLREIHKNIRLQVCCTVNIFNVMYLEQVALWISLQDFDYVYWNMLHDAPCYSIACMPPKAKQLAEARLRAADVEPDVRYEFDRMIDFMNNGTDCDLPYLHDQIKRTDLRRGEDMAAILPELADAIDYDQA